MDTDQLRWPVIRKPLDVWKEDKISKKTISRIVGCGAIWICRHGNRIDFVDPSWQGTDPYLADDGIVQAKETGIRLREEGIQHIFASPFLRTIETAHHIAEAVDLSVKIEHGVCEWLNPKWFAEPPTFVPLDERRRRFPRIDDTYESIIYPKFPETIEELKARCRKAALNLADAYRSSFLVVSHGIPVGRFAQGLLGDQRDISSGLCALTKVNRGDGNAILELNGDVSHLSGGEEHRDKLN
ncbi:MAG: histidine phosphatase family protein [Pseudomonadales bacterium]|nr:histidine phosphatase family protein [Pseudomonadales bacterium]